MRKLLEKYGAELAAAIGLITVLTLLFAGPGPGTYGNWRVLFGIAAAVLAICCLAAGIIGRKEERLSVSGKLKTLEERFSATLSYVPYSVFEYDPAGKAVLPLGRKNFLTETFEGKERVTLTDFLMTVFEDDVEKTEALFLAAGENAPYSAVNIRICRGAEGIPHWYSLVLSCAETDAGVGKPARVMGILEDINARRSETQKLREEADTDALTGLYNRAASVRLIDGMMVSGGKYAFIVVDIDYFKEINDDLGHVFGDEILKEVADALVVSFRGGDVVGRLGGDEFVVFLPGVGSAEIIERKLKKPLALLANPGAHRGHRITLSMGVVIGSEKEDFMELYRKGDAALYRAKEQGRNRMVVCEE